MLNFVAGRGDGIDYADSIGPAVPEQLITSRGRMLVGENGQQLVDRGERCYFASWHLAQLIGDAADAATIAGILT